MAVGGFVSGSASYSRTTSLPSPQNFSACGWARFNEDRDAYNHYFHMGSATSTPPEALYCGVYNDGTTPILFWDGPSDNFGETISTTLAVGDIFFWGVISSGSGVGQQTLYFRRPGVNTFSSVTHTLNYGSWSAAQLYVGSDPWPEPWNGDVWNVKVWDRPLTATELLVESYYRRVMYPTSVHAHWPLRHVDDLYDISGNGRTLTKGGTPTTTQEGVTLLQPRRRIFRSAAVAGGTTLTADSGALTLTGNAATFSQAATLTAETGALTLTGNAATFQLAGGLIADTGALTLTGNAATFTQGTAFLPADRGALTLTGYPVTFSLTGVVLGEGRAYPGPAGRAKRRDRRRRYELPNGVHVYATHEEAAQLAEQMLGREVPVQQIKAARQKPAEQATSLAAPDVALASDDIVRPYVRRREIPRVSQTFVAFTQRAELNEIAFDRLMARLRRRRKAAVLLLFS